ncbi:MAG: hypothetical protein E7294_03645 [Lachnospiraceae bacterium]|jgi:lysophospholipase L1-like esterase|nr:hypothetical protein [Lachnospiraceae bacterium]
MKRLKQLLGLFIFLSAFLLLALIFIIYRDGYFNTLYRKVHSVPYSYRTNAQYTQRETMFEMSPVQKADIIFVGDSITARAEWQEYYPDQVVLNRGIDSDVTEGVYNRLDTIIDKAPDELYLMIGINDIRQGIDKAITLQFYAQILDRLQKELPDCTIYVQSILPVNSSTGIDNKDVEALNASIHSLANERSLTYIDVYSRLIDADHDLPADYSVDGVHMTGAGYQIWLDTLKTHPNP